MRGQTRLRLAEDASFQSLGEGNDTVILSFGSGYLYTCNDTAAAFLRAMDGRRSLDEITDLMEAEFDAPREQMEADFAALAQELVREKLVVPADEQEARNEGDGA